jgi:hypothetical protein
MEMPHQRHPETGKQVVVSALGFLLAGPFGAGAAYCFLRAYTLYSRQYSKFRQLSQMSEATQRLMDKCFTNMIFWALGGVGSSIIAIWHMTWVLNHMSDI